MAFGRVSAFTQPCTAFLILAAICSILSFPAHAEIDARWRVEDNAPALTAPPVHSGFENLSPEQLKPWHMDCAPSEAAIKARVLEKLRWSQYPTINQTKLDAVYYDLEMELIPSSHTIDTELTGIFRVSAASATEMDLDLTTQLTVTSVTINGSPAQFTHQNDIITIDLGGTFVTDDLITVVVAYNGSPYTGNDAFTWDSYGGSTLIWTLSEPFGARDWWACDDWSDDKADSMDLRITIPTGLYVASNGALQSVTTDAGKDTYHWHEGHPITTYLVSLAIHPYTVWFDYYDYGGDSPMDIGFYIFPDHYASTLDANLMVKDQLAFFSSVFGEYPFVDEKYGHAEFPWGGGMEHQTCTSLGAFYESIIAHELAHQWWGDMTTCATFNHIWLNEGFARYSEALWFEHTDGQAGYMGKMDAIRYYGPGTIYVPDLTDWNRIFDGNLSYNKAGWVVHMIRGALGDALFFDFLLAFRAAHEFDSATTQDLITVLNDLTGEDYRTFIEQWIYEEYFPIYEPAWENVTARDGDQLHLTITQQQTNTIFEMPMTVRVSLEGGGTVDLTIDNTLELQEYFLDIPAPATAIVLDPDDWILKQVVDPIVNPTFSQGILLVNGVSWDTYPGEIEVSYEANAFWGDLEIDFWDYFQEPTGGYPSTLPPVLGHGEVPSSILGGYSTVIWVGNNYDGDLNGWQNTNIGGYLAAGGNVILMTRRGDTFLDPALQTYLGINGLDSDTIYDCISRISELSTIARTGTQSWCATFNATLTDPTSTLLYEAQQNFNPDRGIGAWRNPDGGGTHNPNGGHFVFLSGRPYRWNSANLSANVETIVNDLFMGPQDVSDSELPVGKLALRLQNPSRSGARISFNLPADGDVRLAVYDTQGRKIRSLFDATMTAGERSLSWDGATDSGAPITAGVYYIRLETEKQQQVRPLLILR
jgi:Peptidase family M1 domain/Peptidase M1 N-terminal domain/FlgD Ig-like domain